MFIRAIEVKFLEEVTLEMTFQDGKIVRYDMSNIFSKYPQLIALKEDRQLFINGHLDPGGYGVIWNDELDFDAMSIYEDGIVVKRIKPSINQQIGLLLAKTREDKNITQTQLSKMTHVDQADISRIEKGLGNPTLDKINKLFKALGKDLCLILDY